MLYLELSTMFGLALARVPGHSDIICLTSSKKNILKEYFSEKILWLGTPWLELNNYTQTLRGHWELSQITFAFFGIF